MNSFISILAAGISGNARLHEKLGSPEAAQAIDRCLKRMRRSVEAGGGNVVQSGGGELVAAFGAADAVVNAAIEMQQRIADLPPVSGVKMAIRAGISCGDSSVEDGLARKAAHLAGIAKAGQILAVAGICQALPEAMQALATPTDATLPDEPARKNAIVEIQPKAAPAENPQQESDAASSQLRLDYGQAVIVLDEKKPVIDLGRDNTCDVVIRDPRASRHHATINRRGNRVVLIDKSTNGTFVTLDGDSERFVKHAEITLHGKGVIAFAAPSAQPDADCARFECD